MTDCVKALGSCNCYNFVCLGSAFRLVHRCVTQQRVILCWLVRLIPDAVLVEIEEKHEHTGFLSHMQKPGFSVYFVVVNTCLRLYFGFLFQT